MDLVCLNAVEGQGVKSTLFSLFVHSLQIEQCIMFCCCTFCLVFSVDLFRYRSMQNAV